jgi:glycosyltransferase involved in cell wall biosynthesis
MASGIPVVASAVGGLTDTVLDGVTGVLVPPREPDALADALRPLIKDGELRRQLGLAGLLRARSRYGWPRIAHRTAEVYSRLVSERSGAIEEAVNR